MPVHRRPSHPYVMRPRERIPERPTSEDPRDKRIPVVPVLCLTPAALHVIVRAGATDPRIRPADRWLERWGATHGQGEYEPLLARMSLLPRTYQGVPPLDDKDSLLIDGIVQRSESWARTFVMLWYRSTCSTEQIANTLRIRRRQAVYEERNHVLFHFLGRFAEAGLALPVLAAS